MPSWEKRIAALSFALVIPFVVHISLTLLLRAATPRWPWLVVLFALTSLLASVAAGFLFLITPFRGHLLILGIIYFPAMAWVVTYFSMYLFGRLFGSSI